MLTPIVFNEFPQKALDRGMYKKVIPVENGTLDMYEFHVDFDHPFWDKHRSKLDTKHSRMNACIPLKHTGIFYAYNMEDCIDEFCLDYEVEDGYGMISTAGVIYTRDEVSEIYSDFNGRGLLSTGKMRPRSPGTMVNMYGVADDIGQVLKYFRKLMMNPEQKFIISYHTLTPEKDAGWRWHKNGQYIGKQKHSHEHLGDETEVTSIIQYHIYLLKERTQC